MDSARWPWMQGEAEKAYLDPAIDPLDEFDNRPAVADLVVEHRPRIEKLKSKLQGNPLYEPSKHDDLFLLRFCMTHNKSKDALAAIEKTLEFRKKYQLDNKDIRAIPHHRNQDELKKFPLAGDDSKALVRLVQPDLLRGVVLFGRLAMADHETTMKEVTEEQLFETFIYMMEWTFQVTDHATRTTGRLTKSLRIFDLSDVHFRQFHMEYQRREAKLLKRLQDFTPQSLDRIVIVNAPEWIRLAWTLVSPLLPKRIRSKVLFGDPILNESIRKHLREHMSEENLPACFGGQRKEDYFERFE